MKTSDLFKVVPVAAIVMSVYSTSAMAGATNRNENTAATPGPKATTTTTPAHGNVGREEMRRGTTYTENIDTPDSASDLNHPDAYSENRKGAMDTENSVKGDITYGPTKGQQGKQATSGQDASGTGSAGGRGNVEGTRSPDPTDGSTNY